MHWRKFIPLVGLAAALGVIGGGWIHDTSTVAAQAKPPIMINGKPGTEEEMRQLLRKMRLPYQPDTTGSDWRRLSKDVGLEIRSDDRFGLRGHLYIRLKGRWYPVAIEGPQDVAGIVPAR